MLPTRLDLPTGLGFHRRASGGNPAFVTAFNTDSGVEPTLVLDYENDSYWEDVDGTDTFANLHTFTRASVARERRTSVKWADNVEVGVDVKRRDFDGTSRKLLIEEARTNSFLNSDSPATQTISLGTGDHTLWIEGTGSAAVAANTATGTGFGTATEGSPVTFNISGAGTVDVTITGTVDICQLEAGSFATSYIPTAGSSVTRAADTCSVATSAFGFSETEGTFYAQAKIKALTNAATIIGNNISAEIMRLDGTSDDRVTTRYNGNATAVNAVASWLAGAKAAQAYESTGNVAITLDGSSPSTATFSSSGSITEIRIGQRSSSSLHWNGHIKAVVYYDERVPNSDLVALTT